MKNMTFHNFLVHYIKNSLKHKFKDIKANSYKDEFEYKGFYPDLILATGGFVVGIVEVITEEELDKVDIDKIKQMAKLDVKLTLMVPEKLKPKIADFLWQEKLMDKVSIATYDILIKGL